MMASPDGQPSHHPSVDGRFVTTRWSMVLDAGDSLAPEAQHAALERLCRDYWYPLYAYLRRSGRSEPDAQDLTQGFFARLLEQGNLRGLERGKGRFRSFLLKSLKNYVTNEWHKENALKRGGGAMAFSIDQDAEERYVREPACSETPEVLFQRAWARTLLERVMQTLSDESAAVGRAKLFHSLRSCLSGRKQNQEAARYSLIAEEHGMTVGAVTMAVRRMRQRYGDLLRKEIADTVDSPDEVDDEIRFLLSSLAA